VGSSRVGVAMLYWWQAVWRWCWTRAGRWRSYWVFGRARLPPLPGVDNPLSRGSRIETLVVVLVKSTWARAPL
jgi:hypothetical protein